jgi:hypothetical protein
MPAIEYRVTPTEEQVQLLEAMLRKGESTARKQTGERHY